MMQTKALDHPAAGPGTTTDRSVRRGLIVAICCMSVGVTGIDITIVNVALPSIGAQLHASVSSLQWTVDAYALVLACLLVLSGSLADRFGRRRVFQLGLSLFSLGSLLCALAPGIGWLIAFRGLQAVGGSMLNPVALSIIVGLYDDPRQRARAIGIWGSSIGLAIAAGPVLGGVLVDSADWRSVFWVTVPIGIAALALTHRFVPESKADRARALDPFGQVLIVVLFASVVATTIEGPAHGWTNPWIIALMALALAALLGLLVAEPRRDEPLIDLRFFRSPPFAAANAIAVLMSAGLSGFLFLNTLYLQDVREFSPLHAGILVIPMAAGQAVASTVSGRLVAARGPRVSLAVGGALLSSGSLLLLPLTGHTSTAYLLAVFTVFGLAIGMISPPITNTAMSGMPSARTGLAGALVASARQFGGAIGVAVVGSIVAGTGAGFVGSSRPAWVVLGVGGLLSLALGLLSTSRWAKDVAARNGQRLSRAL